MAKYAEKDLGGWFSCGRLQFSLETTIFAQKAHHIPR